MGLSSLSRSFHSFFDRFGTQNLPVYGEDWPPAMAVQDGGGDFFQLLIGERDNSVYGLRAGSQGWKGEDGKAKTQ